MTQNFAAGNVFGGSVSIVDPQEANNSAYVDHFHNLQTVTSVKLCGSKFVGTTKDTNFWSEVVAGTGSVAQARGAITLATGSTANSSATYTTVRIARFIPATTNTCRFVLRLSNTGSANNIRQWGMYDASNGMFFQLNGTTLNFVTRANGVDTPIAQASWNTNPTSFTLDSNIHSFDIYASYKQCLVYIDDVQVLHYTTSGVASPAWENLNLPVVLSNVNSGGGTADVSLQAWIAVIRRLGEHESVPKYGHISGNAATWVFKYGAGDLHELIFNNTSGTNITIYDGVSAAGTVIGVITTTSGAIGSWAYHCAFSTGLCIVTTGNSLDMTVVYD